MERQQEIMDSAFDNRWLRGDCPGIGGILHSVVRLPVLARALEPPRRHLVPFKLTDAALESVSMGNIVPGASAEFSLCLDLVNDDSEGLKLKVEDKVLSRDITTPRSVRS
jgi:hypothetical protein